MKDSSLPANVRPTARESWPMDAEHGPAMPNELAEIRLRLAAALAGAAGGWSAEPVTAGVAAYELARLDGLCHDGAWECALEAAYRALAGARIDEW